MVISSRIIYRILNDWNYWSKPFEDLKQFIESKNFTIKYLNLNKNYKKIHNNETSY